ncbi:MAG: hypothetical protein ACTSQ2_13910 [Candidatus Heimdallarchaeaceae archaeon]
MNYSDDEKLDYFISFFSECTNEHGELKYLIELQNSLNMSFKHFLIYLKDLEHWNPFFAENISIDELKTKEIIKKALAFVALDEEYPSEIIAFIPELDISFSSSEKKWYEKKEEVLLIERNFSMEGHITKISVNKKNEWTKLILIKSLETGSKDEILVKIKTTLIRNIEVNDYVIIQGYEKQLPLRKGRTATIEYEKIGTKIDKEANFLIRINDRYIAELLETFPEDKEAILEISKKATILEEKNRLNLPKSVLSSQLCILSLCRFYISPKYNMDKYWVFFSSGSTLNKEELQGKTSSILGKLERKDLVKQYGLIKFEFNFPFLKDKISKQVDATFTELINRFPKDEEIIRKTELNTLDILELEILPIHHVTMSVDSLYFILLNVYYPIKKDFERFRKYFTNKHKPQSRGFGYIHGYFRRELDDINLLESLIETK